VAELVREAVDRGARVVTGGGDPDGNFYAPTVLADVPSDARIAREEIFGPVAPVSTFASDDEAIAMANDTEYGLASYMYTASLDRTIKMVERLEFGMVGVNTGLVSNPAAPFGGVKFSGFGREGGFEGIEEYLDTVYVGLAAD
jgi:succinate-semialdehyde dehydrogenase/glutarate-semialdehyde dehydrogenase